MNADAPAEPTSEQCNANERVSIPGSDTPAYAAWWPQMGGYSGRAVITAGDCPEVWVWHDGQFPFRGDSTPDGHPPDRPPVRLHLCDSDQWIELFERQKAWAAEWRGDAEEPEPYIWRLPQGVTHEQAREVYEAGLAWGLWEPDPGGFEIVTWENQRHVCEPIPCPQFTEVDLQTSYAAPAEWEPEDPLLVQIANNRLDQLDRAMVAASRPTAPLARMMARVPQVLTLPEDVTPEQAMEWIRGCGRLGLVEPSPAGHLFFPPGVGL